ncbi:MAG: hypothetical protein HFJ02_03115 [Bacilli bacterium]|nr:hypothetical protein [Bacilli bacterium]
MENDITRKIDTLVEMSESTLNVDTANAELQEIDSRVIFLNTESDLLNEEGKKEKYFKASEKQVDENIKVSLEAKIKKQERAIQNLQKEIDNIVDEEIMLHNIITKLQNSIGSSNEYIGILNDRYSAISDSENKTYYQKLLQDENQKLEDLIASLHLKEEEHNNVLENLNTLNSDMEEMQEKLENEKARLAETKANLLNPLSYINEEMKKIDEDRKNEIKKELKSLEKRREEILNDPVMIANEVKTLILEDEREKALAKIKELVSIAKSKPFMDIPNGAELAALLKDEEESAILARDEFAGFIDTKNYMDQDNKVIEERINYLDLEINGLEEKIRMAKEEIKKIDTIEIQQLNERLENTLEVEAELENDLKNYQIIMESEQEDKTPKRRAILAAAFNTKQNELANVLNLVNHYKYDQKILIGKAYKLEAIDIKKYEEEIFARQEEILEMTALLRNTNKVKDVLAIENDKKKLKELDDAVKDIKHRAKYSQTPSEIYDEIEIYLGSMGLDLSFGSEEDELSEMNYTMIDDFEDDKSFEEPSDNDLDVSNFVVDDSSELDVASFSFEEANVDLDEIVMDLPIEEKTGERLQVINIENLEENIDDSFIIGSYDEVA